MYVYYVTSNCLSKHILCLQVSYKLVQLHLENTTHNVRLILGSWTLDSTKCVISGHLELHVNVMNSSGNTILLHMDIMSWKSSTIYLGGPTKDDANTNHFSTFSAGSISPVLIASSIDIYLSNLNNGWFLKPMYFHNHITIYYKLLEQLSAKQCVWALSTRSEILNDMTPWM